MALTLSELRGLSDDELVERYDAMAQSTSPGLNFWIQELLRRDSLRLANANLEHAREVARLTRVITVLTAVNALAAIVAVVAALG